MGQEKDFVGVGEGPLVRKLLAQLPVGALELRGGQPNSSPRRREGDANSL